MHPRAVLIASVATILTMLGACTPYDPQLSDMPFYCGDTDPKCPDGYTCQVNGNGSGVCTNGKSVPHGSCATPGQGVLASWDLTGEPGTQTSTTASTTLPGVITLPLARSAALMPSPGTDSISASNWATATQPDPSSYYTLSIGAPAGCSLTVTAVALDVKSSTTGPASAGVATSADGFAQNTTASTTVPGELSLSVAASTAMLELRIFGYGASATTGTMRVQHQLSVTGSVN